MSVILVCGSRGWDDSALLAAVLHGVYNEGDTIRHGACPSGADYMADLWARMLGYPVDPMPAEWERYGKKQAGPIRNAAMAVKQPKPRLCVAFLASKEWSPGTANMIRQIEGNCPVILVQKR